jgi:uncharacterized protein (AIM24 family)
MTFMDQDIGFEAKLGDGTSGDGGFMGKLFSVGKRALIGESLFLTHFTNRGQSRQRVAFGAPYPGKIIPIDLRVHGGELICQKDAFLCAAYGTRLDIAFTRRFGAGLFGGEGFILERLSGDGLAFVHAGGTIVKHDLQGQTLRLDTGCLVAMTAGIEYDIERSGSLKSMIFGGEGLFLATVRGYGSVWIQSLPFSRLADRVLSASRAGSGRADEGSILGGFGRMFED